MAATTNRPAGPLALALAGLRRARTNLPLALILWAAHLAIAVVVTAPFAAGLARLTAERPAADTLLGRPPLDLFVQVLRDGGELFSSFGPALAAACALALLLNALLAGGVLEVLLTADARSLLHRFARGAGHFAVRMLQLGAWATLLGAALAALGAMPMLLFSKRLAERDHEIAASWLRLGGLALAGLLLLIVLLALDLARVRVVREDRAKRVLRLLVASIGIVLRHPIRVLGVWVLLAVAFVLLLGLYTALASLLPTASISGILLVALLQQLLTIGRSALRVALWSAEIELLETASGPGTPDGKPREPVPVTASPAALPPSDAPPASGGEAAAPAAP